MDNHKFGHESYADFKDYTRINFRREFTEEEYGQLLYMLDVYAGEGDESDCDAIETLHELISVYTRSIVNSAPVSAHMLYRCFNCGSHTCPTTFPFYSLMSMLFAADLEMRIKIRTYGANSTGRWGIVRERRYLLAILRAFDDFAEADTEELWSVDAVPDAVCGDDHYIKGDC